MREINNPEKHIPYLGDIGKYSKSIIHSSFDKIGNPIISKPIGLAVMEVPFTKSKFKSYNAIKKGMGEKSALAYIDSIPIKPKYLTIEITDRIGMRTALNTDKNKEVLSYLEQDEDYRLVYQVSMVASEEQSRLLMEADAIFLIEDWNGHMTVEAIHNKIKIQIRLSQSEIFDYKVLGFCWSENRYGQKRIEALRLSSESCPKNTERKAYQLSETKSYIKL
ncbi:hypothetical protein B4Q04_20110 [Zobellia sp. OII3]|nr:hypothetical protein B4Q04_20110 [Zobellia sp. OII3]